MILNISQLLKRTILYLIRFYQLLSTFTPRICRFYPTCSEYTLEAIKCYGILKGSLLGVKRILKCHPFHPGGYDPVKNKRK